MLSTRIRGSLAVGAAAASLCLATVAGTIGTASADAPPSGDSRATSFEGNAVDCDDAKLSGSVLNKEDFTYTGGKNNVDQYLTITSVDPGVVVSGIVVKAGDGFNVYEPGKRGLSAVPPWEDLHGPLVGKKGQIPAISHWFVCGTTAPPPTTTTESSTSSTSPTSSTSSTSLPSIPTEPPPTTSSGTQPTTTSEPTQPTETESTSSAPIVPPGSPPPPGAVPPPETGPSLPTTGFTAAPLAWLGGLLLASGALVLTLIRRRRSGGR